MGKVCLVLWEKIFFCPMGKVTGYLSPWEKVSPMGEDVFSAPWEKVFKHIGKGCLAHGKSFVIPMGKVIC